MNNLNTHPFSPRHTQIDSPKAHNCPNCQCGNNHNQHTSRVIISRQQSPVIERLSPTHKLLIGQPNILIKAHSPENIYFRRTDLNTSNSSIKSNTSVSRQKNVQPTRVNIRFCSPARDSRKDFKSPVSTIPHVIYPQINRGIHNQPTQIQNKFIPSLYHTKTYESNNIMTQRQQSMNWNEDEPPTPSILKRKTSGVKKSTQILQRNIASPRIYRQNQFEKVSAILKNVTITPEDKNKQMMGSAYKMLLEDSQQKALMQQLSNDLKLNYDYLETADISNDSVS